MENDTVEITIKKKKNKKLLRNQQRKNRKNPTSIKEIFQKMKQLKNKFLLATKIQIFQTLMEKEEKNIWKIIAVKEKVCCIT